MTDTNATQRGKASAVLAMLGCSFAIGIVIAGMAPHLKSPQQQFLVQVFGNVLLLGVGFRWLHLDSLERGVRRSPLFNVGIVAAAAVFVPFYFVRTRPQGQRVLPILAFFGLILASALCTAAGMMTLGIVLGRD